MGYFFCSTRIYNSQCLRNSVRPYASEREKDKQGISKELLLEWENQTRMQKTWKQASRQGLENKHTKKSTGPEPFQPEELQGALTLRLSSSVWPRNKFIQSTYGWLLKTRSLHPIPDS